MFRKKYVGYHGFTTFVQGVWCFDDDGERQVRVTSVGHDDDEIGVGQVLSLDEIDQLDGDGYAQADRLAGLLVA